MLLALVAVGIPMGVAMYSYASVGRAAAVKMFRSIVYKGIEALLFECVLGAGQYGAEERVFASLKESLPGVDWKKLADYMVGRVVVHGERRAREMDEVAKTLEELGITGMFDAITGGEEVKKGKPDPEVFLVSARKLGLKPGDCIVFEDSHVGIQAGLSAGMEVIGMATTHTRAELSERPLLAILDDYEAMRTAELKKPS